MSSGRQRARAVSQKAVADAVARLVAERGIDAVSLRAVAAEAGTSMGNIQYRFGTVADLVLFALGQVVDDLEALLGPTDERASRTRLRRVAEALLTDEPAATTTIRAYAQLRTSAARDPRALDLLTALHERRVDEFAAILEDARAQRLLHSMVDPRHEADVFWTLLQAIAIEVAQGIRTRDEGLETLRYHFLRLARNRRVTRPLPPVVEGVLERDRQSST